MPDSVLLRSLRTGDHACLEALLARDPARAAAPIRGAGGRTPLHVVADWPGYVPGGTGTVTLLVAAGADPDARGPGAHPETPLHWAASSDDIDIARALVVGGADVEARGASIAGGTALANAVGYGCWHVARLLVAHGAAVETLWQAAALGLIGPLEQLLAAGPARRELDQAFYHACEAGQRRTAELLLARGADPAAPPAYAGRSALEAVLAPDTRRETMADRLRGFG